MNKLKFWPFMWTYHKWQFIGVTAFMLLMHILLLITSPKDTWYGHLIILGVYGIMWFRWVYIYHYYKK